MQLFSDFAVVNTNSIFLFQHLIDIFIKGLIFLGTVGFILWLTRNKSAELRHRIISLSLLSMIILPIVSIFSPAWNLPVFSLDILGSAKQNVQNITNATENLNKLGYGEVKSASEAKKILSQIISEKVDSQENSSRKLHWSFWIILIWGSFTAFILFWQIIGKLRVHKIIKHAEVVRDKKWISIMKDILWEKESKKKINLYTSEIIKVPVVVRLFKPLILIPKTAIDWPAETIKVLLLHETAHLRRHDLLVQMIAQIACVLHWFNPLVWLVAQRLFIEQERTADDYVINHGIKVSEYAKHLIEASERVKFVRHTSLDVAAMARGTDFKDRMLCVLDPGAKRKSLELGENIMFAVIILLIFAPLASLNPWGTGYEWPQAGEKQLKANSGSQDKIKNFVPGVHDYLEKYLKDDDLYVRLSAVVALEEVEAPESVSGLVAACVEGMGNESYYIRLVASNVLLKLDNPEKFPMVPEACVKAFYDEYTPVQLNATNIIRKIEKPSKIPGIDKACRHALQEDYQPVRQNAMVILGRIRG